VQLHNLLAAEGSPEVPEEYEKEGPAHPQVGKSVYRVIRKKDFCIWSFIVHRFHMFNLPTG